MRDYQKAGFNWLKALAKYRFGGILADDMGLGKTLQSIAFIQSELPEIRRRQAPVLIVAPSSLTYNWLEEFTKFTPDIKAVIIDGNKTRRTKRFADNAEADVLITSYPSLRMDGALSVSYTHLRAHETRHDLVCRLLLEKKKYTSPSPRDKRQSRMPSSA